MTVRGRLGKVDRVGTGHQGTGDPGAAGAPVRVRPPSYSRAGPGSWTSRALVTPPRVMQITNLLLLAPEIQEAVLELPAVTKTVRDPISDRALRRVASEWSWDRQKELWLEIRRAEQC